MASRWIRRPQSGHDRSVSRLAQEGGARVRAMEHRSPLEGDVLEIASAGGSHVVPGTCAEFASIPPDFLTGTLARSMGTRQAPGDAYIYSHEGRPLVRRPG